MHIVVRFVADAVVCGDSRDAAIGSSDLVLEAIELMDVCLLEPIPQKGKWY